MLPSNKTHLLAMGFCCLCGLLVIVASVAVSEWQRYRREKYRSEERS